VDQRIINGEGFLKYSDIFECNTSDCSNLKTVITALNQSWREIVRIKNTQKMVTTTIENTKGDTIQIRQSSEPSEDVRIICTKLKYRQIPMPRKKYVWHSDENLKNQKSDCQLVMDG
jgi:hypothetical protein